MTPLPQTTGVEVGVGVGTPTVSVGVTVVVGVSDGVPVAVFVAETGCVFVTVGVGPLAWQPSRAFATPLMSCAMSTWPCEFWNAGQALVGCNPSAMFTPGSSH
jgi:hypothetical protein